MSKGTVPCQYRTGKTIGSGTYAIVKEAVHIGTGQYYACKIINKKLMEGREHMVRNEIAILKRISNGHPNIVTLHDYFETSHNLYLCFDLCTGGELFDRICAKGNYYEADAADLVRTIFSAVKYIHAQGIVHRDLKPENLLFRTPAEDADIMIADFGLSRIMEEEKLSLLTEVCGTMAYMAPEVFLKTGHGKPVDVWAIGVVTYFLLAGYTPFDRETPKLETEAIIAGDYKFEPEEYWGNISDAARNFIKMCLTVDPTHRPTATEALQHKWLAPPPPYSESDSSSPTDLLPQIKKAFNAKLAWKKAAVSIQALNRMSALARGTASTSAALAEKVRQYQAESAQEVLEVCVRAPFWLAILSHTWLMQGTVITHQHLDESVRVAQDIPQPIQRDSECPAIPSGQTVNSEGPPDLSAATDSDRTLSLPHGDLASTTSSASEEDLDQDEGATVPSDGPPLATFVIYTPDNLYVMVLALFPSIGC
ncbi:Pkinase-domain-containing protein [Mycena latifolia]|nr:Pkinase-domain-containing protein [Mycena latifolia]